MHNIDHSSNLLPINFEIEEKQVLTYEHDPVQVLWIHGSPVFVHHQASVAEQPFNISGSRRWSEVTSYYSE